MKEKISNNIQIKNKRATFDYELLDTFTAGIVLTGTEIKSIRLGKASLVDTFCIVEKGELWVKNMYIAEYFYGTYNNHNARRDRKLLLTKKELRKIEGAVRASGFTIVPTRLFINEKGLAKVVVAIARGKKEYDKFFNSDADGSYASYVGSYNSKNKERRVGNKRTSEELYKEIKKLLKDAQKEDENVQKILTSIENETFLPKQLTASNGVIPNQVHARELKKILSCLLYTSPSPRD